ncbi:hypothetical protein V8C35DRAFT_326385 [Trichoderma chlorosporum]
MPPFEAPRPPFRSSQLRTWFDNVEPRMQNHLWGDYWKRFNTMTIPILGESDYFNAAIEVAKLAKGRKAECRKAEFERMFEERIKKQREKVLSFMAKAAHQTIYSRIFPCEDAQDIVSQVCLTGSLLDFLRLLNGNAFVWEADAAENVQLDGATSNLSEEAQSPVNQKIQDPYDEPTQMPDDDFYLESMERQIREEQSASATYYIGTYTYARCATPQSHATIFRQATRPKRDRFDNDVPGDLKSITHTSMEQTTDGSVTHQKSSLDNTGYDRVYKRRKLERPCALEPTSTNPSSELAANKGTIKKRSRDDDCDDEHRHKYEKFAVKKHILKINCSSRQKKKPSSKISRSPKQSTRSARRKEPF